MLIMDGRWRKYQPPLASLHTDIGQMDIVTDEMTQRDGMLDIRMQGYCDRQSYGWDIGHTDGWRLGQTVFWISGQTDIATDETSG
ncbi:hypothetical protein CAEBREN_16210 [Caenorhabditis brenneri]|uniref:Uncharacterized protein n=1 Tax=Caenorhabditis brenneri TaxID=135651 RepID=G0P1F4_CAEBE|nr:hypothetical protein CAEBREN_16210 [Caenorhabditis brenneri]